jgi:hypothetical protein
MIVGKPAAPPRCGGTGAPHCAWHFKTVVGVVFAVMAASSAPPRLYGLYQQQWHFGATTSTVIYACYALGDPDPQRTIIGAPGRYGWVRSHSAPSYGWLPP